MTTIFRRLFPVVCFFLLIGSDINLFRWIATAAINWADSVSRKEAVSVAGEPIKISARRSRPEM